jgi:rubrerythrin
MELNTASAIINFALKLEDDAANFYESAARQYGELEELFEGFAKENVKFAKTVKRAYYEVISDALEAGFSFAGINANDYAIETGLPEGKSQVEVLEKAFQIEEKMEEFYSAAAGRSKSLMADIPRAFERLAERRAERKHSLTSFLKT